MELSGGTTTLAQQGVARNAAVSARNGGGGRDHGRARARARVVDRLLLPSRMCAQGDDGFALIATFLGELFTACAAPEQCRKFPGPLPAGGGPRAAAACILVAFRRYRGGRLAVDEPLANRVRSGRKQP
jgi:hypothetical protein